VQSRAFTALPMSRDEARQCVARIAHHLEEARALLLELYEREGWRALGYDSWRACVTAEFAESQATLYRQLTAARIERTISHNEKSGARLPVLHALELVRQVAQVAAAIERCGSYPALSATAPSTPPVSPQAVHHTSANPVR